MKPPILTIWIGLGLFFSPVYAAWAQEPSKGTPGDPSSVPNSTINPGLIGGSLPSTFAGPPETGGVISKSGSETGNLSALSGPSCEKRPGGVFFGVEYLFMKPRR